MANTLRSKGYFSNNGLYIDTYLGVACDVKFSIDEEDSIPNIDVQEYSGGHWVDLDPEEDYKVTSSGYDIVRESDSESDEEPVHETITDHIQIAIKSAKNKLYRVKYHLEEFEGDEPCDNCAGCLDTAVCRAYVNTDGLRNAALDLVNNMCNDACDVPINLVNRLLELFSLEIAADKENNCAAVAKLYDKYIRKLELGGSSSDCGCHGK